MLNITYVYVVLALAKHERCMAWNGILVIKPAPSPADPTDCDLLERFCSCKFIDVHPRLQKGITWCRQNGTALRSQLIKKSVWFESVHVKRSLPV
jgi:hypothetical protein